nr:xylosyltransferase oxt-like [Procambarus clarkii]
MAIAPVRAILIVSFNIFRVVCRKYGLYLVIGMMIILFQGFSGYYVLRLGSDERLVEDFGRSNALEEASMVERAQSDVESRMYQANDRGDADSHNKGPPDAVEIDSKELSKDWLGIDTPCGIRSKESLSAIKRATTVYCKNLIANISCQIQSGSFYPSRLQSYCPSNVDFFKLLYVTESEIFFCTCLIYSFNRKECFCGNEEIPLKMKVADSMCNMPCSGDQELKCGDYLHINIYQTGLAKYVPPALKGPSLAGNNTPVRIVFVLTVNGRAMRQLKRLIKALYHKDHFFFIHVDSRQDYLFREVLKLEKEFRNIQVSRYRLSTIWGGASLLKILLHCMQQILQIKSWNWNFIINLSESDYPIKRNDELVRFLTNNRERNFLKSHGHDTNKFLQKQGLDRTFLECETHMWRIGERRLPLGIRVDGGSDWLCLNRDFVEYVVNSQDQLVKGLKKVYSYTLLPAESFFHTVLRNSRFCQSFTDNNLHVTNWKRKLGCKCQYKHIVDWCGCSPNDFIPGDWPKLEASTSRNLFFARKFEPVISQAIINQVDAWLYTPYYSSTPGLESYWENRYHHKDKLDGGNDAALTLYHAGARLGTRALAQLVNAEKSKCNVYATSVLQVHSYHLGDTFKGLLVQYIGNIDSLRAFPIETWIFPRIKYRLPFEKTNHRLLVGSEFDVKEQVFRNLGGALGPNSDITVVTRWSGGVTGDARVAGEDTVQHPLVVLSDPTSTLAAEGKITLEPGEQVVSHNFDMRKPLLPGSWMVRVMIDNVVTASHSFLILPLQVVHGRQISVKEARALHKGPSGSYTDADLSNTCLLLSLGHHGNSSAQEVSASHSTLYGPQLSQWIDNLAQRFYTIQDSCYIASQDVPVCVRSLLDPCEKTTWSSQSPDPKSHLGEVDQQSGRIADSYRVGSGEFR